VLTFGQSGPKRKKNKDRNSFHSSFLFHFSLLNPGLVEDHHFVTSLLMVQDFKENERVISLRSPSSLCSHTDQGALRAYVPVWTQRRKEKGK
jgi:hypothetical protein